MMFYPEADSVENARTIVSAREATRGSFAGV